MDYSIKLRNRLKANAATYAEKHSLSGTECDTAFIFDSSEMNFEKDSYEAIEKNTDWLSRTQKTHSHFSNGTLEMQSSNSSDALLMNIFCNPEFTSWKGPQQLLKIDTENDFQFGWNPHFANENPIHPTEVDLKIGDHIFEAKLTEKSFTTKCRSVVLSYENFSEVFEESCLLTKDDEIQQYQLVRNILTAHKYNFRFTVLVDASRIDLIQEFINVLKSVKSYELRSRINIVTWQEIVGLCGNNLKSYIQERYFN